VQHRIIDLPGRPSPFHDQIDAARTLWIPFIGLHRGADFLPLLVIGAAGFVGCDRPAAQPVGAAAFMHQRGGGHRPSVTDLGDQELGLDLGICKKHLVERRMAVHLPQRLNRHTRLFHIQDEIGQALMLLLVPIGARQQQSPMCLVRAGRPDLLPVHHPLIAAELGPRYRTGHVRSAAGFTEQLAPDVLTGQNAEQELLLLQVGAVRKNGRGGQGADAYLGDADGADPLELLLDHGHEANRKVATVPA